MKNIRLIGKLFFMGMLALYLQGCISMPHIYKKIDSSKYLKKNEIILVGSVSLVPKLKLSEQKITEDSFFIPGSYKDRKLNHFVMQLNHNSKSSDSKSVINPQLDKLFYIKIPKKMKYIVDGEIHTEFMPGYSTAQIKLPTGFIINIRPTDRAVYIGKLIYTRDDFNSIKAIELKDKYKYAVKRFKRKFGSKIKLRKSLIKRIKQ